MKLNNKIGGIPQKIVSTVFFLVTFVCLFYFFTTAKYLPFFLASIIVIMPVAVNIVLHLFACEIPFKKPQKKVLAEGTKKIKKLLHRAIYILKLCVYGVAFAYNKSHRIL